MAFEKREILLILGVLFLMIGLLPFLAPVYSVIIAIVAYFGIKVFVGRRKKWIQKDIGEGICAVCGAKITHKLCPNCDKASTA